jgi:hypothetical protein
VGNRRNPVRSLQHSAGRDHPAVDGRSNADELGCSDADSRHDGSTDTYSE